MQGYNKAWPGLETSRWHVVATVQTAAAKLCTHYHPSRCLIHGGAIPCYAQAWEEVFSSNCGIKAQGSIAHFASGADFYPGMQPVHSMHRRPCVLMYPSTNSLIISKCQCLIAIQEHSTFAADHQCSQSWKKQSIMYSARCKARTRALNADGCSCK